MPFFVMGKLLSTMIAWPYSACAQATAAVATYYFLAAGNYDYIVSVFFQLDGSIRCQACCRNPLLWFEF